MSSSPRPKLRIDWCSYDAAKYAVRHWHYSRSLPCSKTARLGVWEDDKFIGSVVFAWGANRHLAGEYKLKMTECAELCRIALTEHTTPVSKILSIAVKMLKREMPGIRLLVSYADLNHGHHLGKIYQASNWLFVGETGHEAGIMLNGKLTHRRTINSKYGTSDIDWLRKRVDPCADRHQGNSNICCPWIMKSLNALSYCQSRTPNAPQAETSLRQTPSLERPGKHRARRSSCKSLGIE
jgi:hypothetical protein